MAREGDRWRVVRGDCLWNIARSVYGNAYRWTEIADANGISRSTALIYPGQLLTLPGITAASPTPAPAPAPPPPPTTKCRVDWFQLMAGENRKILAVFSYSGAKKFLCRWEIKDPQSGRMIVVSENQVTVTDEQPMSIGDFSSYESKIGWNEVMFSVRPLDDNGNWKAYTDWERAYWDFRNNPPDLPPTPSITIDGTNTLIVEMANIPESYNTDTIEFAIYQDYNFKWKTATATINTETRYLKFTCQVDPGHSYIVRCRGVKNGNNYGGWTDYSNMDLSTPIAPSEITTLQPQIISEQMSKIYAVLVEWTPVENVKSYIVQWAENVELFETGDAHSQQTEEGKGARLLITGIDLGHEYFFRIGSINDKGQSLDWSPIRSVRLGSRPSAPTTYSNVVSCVIGEDLNLYWVHNATDGSIERYARIHFTLIDTSQPEALPMEFDEVVANEKPEDEKDKTSVYVVNTENPKFALLGAGYIIKWKVQTAGVADEYSPWSIERVVNVYEKPEVVLDLLNLNQQSTNEINSFPFYISVLAKPPEQIPISYYIEVVSNDPYQTVDEIGNVKMVNIGDKIYEKYYDPTVENKWRFILEMTPANLDLENDINYTINVTVAMNSGLTAISSINFVTHYEDYFYDVYGLVVVNHESLEASIHPFCKGITNEEVGEATLIEDCLLSVYRREYDGSFTEIAKDVNNEENLYVTDPHPSLDYARYRITAKDNKTGAISYSDLPPIEVKEPYAVVQWAEKWSKFSYDDSGEGNIEPPWAGSMLKIPYNLGISDSKNGDVSLVEYVGRKRPVSYHGTQLGEASNWSMSIPKYDKDTLYTVRRLAAWNYSDLTIPITLSITRVEGGI